MTVTKKISVCEENPTLKIEKDFKNKEFVRPPSQKRVDRGSRRYGYTWPSLQAGSGLACHCAFKQPCISVLL